MKRNSGFTIIELMSVLVLVIIVIALIFVQKNNLDASYRDQTRKISANAVYYGLKYGYYPQNKSYPTTINSKILPFISPKSFQQVGQDNKYRLHYRGLDCEAEKCQNFELSTNLEKEATYKKTND